MIDLSRQDMERICQILREHIPSVEVRVFGSRVRGTATPCSDLDLALLGEEPLSLSVLGGLREAFEDSDLSFRVDLVDWHRISDSFKEVIENEFEHIRCNEGPDDDRKSG